MCTLVLNQYPRITRCARAEFCENEVDASEQTKHDCELKAFHRLARKLNIIPALTPRWAGGQEGVKRVTIF